MSFTIHTRAEQPIAKHFMLMERHLYRREIPSSIQDDMVVWVKKGFGEIYWSDEDIEKLRSQGSMYLNKRERTRILGKYNRIIRDFWIATREILDELEGGVARSRLAFLYDRFCTTLFETFAYFPATTDKMTAAVEEQLRKSCPEGFIAITTPAKPDLLHKELVDWLKVCSNPAEEAIMKHTKKYLLMLPNTYSTAEAIAWARDRLSAKPAAQVQKQIEKNERRHAALQAEQKKIFASNPHSRELAVFLQNVSLLRLELKACWNGECYLMLPLYERIAAIAKSTVCDLNMFYLPREISNLVHNNCIVSPKVIAARKEHYLMWLHGQRIELYYGEKAAGMKKNLRLWENTIISELTGTIANKGIVRGRAKVVKTDNPNAFIETGKSLHGDEILVAGMTNPAMVVMLEKVKGIVTDEGGATCHAAIISRELGIPCIVGTKHATEWLKDGDLIELDADSGIVRRC